MGEDYVRISRWAIGIGLSVIGGLAMQLFVLVTWGSRLATNVQHLSDQVREVRVDISNLNSQKYTRADAQADLGIVVEMVKQLSARMDAQNQRILMFEQTHLTPAKP